MSAALFPASVQDVADLRQLYFEVYGHGYPMPLGIDPGGHACGSHAPRPELLGHYGDVVRVGTYFINYQRFIRVLEELLAYHGEVQLLVAPGADRERLTVRLDEQYSPDPDVARAMLAAEVRELVMLSAKATAVFCSTAVLPDHPVGLILVGRLFKSQCVLGS